jgi:hypothetical protein
LCCIKRVACAAVAATNHAVSNFAVTTEQLLLLLLLLCNYFVLKYDASVRCFMPPLLLLLLLLIESDLLTAACLPFVADRCFALPELRRGDTAAATAAGVDCLLSGVVIVLPLLAVGASLMVLRNVPHIAHCRKFASCVQCLYVHTAQSHDAAAPLSLPLLLLLATSTAL